MCVGSYSQESTFPEEMLFVRIREKGNGWILYVNVSGWPVSITDAFRGFYLPMVRVEQDSGPLVLGGTVGHSSFLG